MKRFWMGLALIAAGLTLAGCDMIPGFGGGGGGPKNVESLDGNGISSSPWQIETDKTYKGEIAVSVGDLGGHWFTITFEEVGIIETVITKTNGTSDLGLFLYETLAQGGDYLGLDCDNGFVGDEICQFTVASPTAVDIQNYNFGPTTSEYNLEISYQ